MQADFIHPLIDSIAALSVGVPARVRERHDSYTMENREVDPADKCVGAIEWVNRIYDADWYELYAVSVDSFDSGIAVGGTLSAGEWAEIQEAIRLRYGDISSARQALIDTALGQVGAVRYYWGGKPVNAGMPLTVSLNGAGTAVWW